MSHPNMANNLIEIIFNFPRLYTHPNIVIYMPITAFTGKDVMIIETINNKIVFKKSIITIIENTDTTLSSLKTYTIPIIKM